MSALQTDLWSHQRDGLDFLRSNPAALLAYDMGTGKTLTTIARIAEMPHGSKILIVCPKAVIPTWPDEMEKHLDRAAWPYQILPMLKGTGAKKAKALDELQRTMPPHHSLVVVVNYETAMAKAMAPSLLGIGWDLLIFDESHKIKAPTGKASKFCARLRAPSRVALTGTPMPHSPLDVFAQARALGLPLYGRSFVSFRARYAVFDPKPIYRAGKVVPGAKTIIGWQRMGDFEDRLARWAVQVRADDVLDLPDKHDVKVPVELSDRELRAYMAMEDELVAQVEGGTLVASNAAVKLGKLAQMTGGFCLDEDGEALEVGTSKRDALAEIVDGLALDEPLVVFARFRSDLEAVHAVAEKLGRVSMELSGSRNELADWKAATCGEILAVQIQAGGAGIDLTRACKAVYYSVSFSLGDYDQSRARVHRPGQDRKVTYFHLAAKGTVDERIYRMLASRKNLIEGILEALKKE